MNFITVAELAMWREGGMPFDLIDVRRDSARASNGLAVPGARWLNPAHWLDWKDGIAADRIAVLYCAHGHEISHGLVAALRAMGVDARGLSGGMTAWQAAQQPVVPATASAS